MYPPAVCLWARKGRYNLCMNHASLDRESLDRVSLISTTRLSHIINKTRICQ